MAALAYIITVVLCWRSPLLSQLEKTKVRCCVCNVRDGRVVTSSGTSHIHQPDTFLEQPMDTHLFLSESPWWCKIDIKQIFLEIFLSSRVDQCENICILCKYLNVVNNIIHATTRTKKNIARGTTDPGYWVHNSNHPNSRSMLSLHCWHGVLFLISYIIEFCQQNKWYFVFSYPPIYCNQICHSFHFQNS